MKKLISVLLFITMMLGVLSACGTGGNTPSSSTTTVPQATTNDAPGTSNDTTQKGYDKELKFTVAMPSSQTTVLAKNNLFDKKIKEEFNMVWDIEYITSEYDQKMRLQFATNDYPEVLENASIGLVNELSQTGKLANYDNYYDKIPNYLDIWKDVDGGFDYITGRVFYSAKIVIDTTGDADILYRAGVPTMQGKNFFTMISLYASLESAAQAVESGDISMLIRKISGGEATLHGKNHPDGMKTFTGTNAEDVTDFLLKNQLKTLNSLKQTERTARDVLMLPAMAQFRTTRCLIGDDVFSMDNVYRHCETSIGAICDFERRDYLYEIPYGALVKTGYDNLITAGRTASAKPDYSWDILRVIPPAILTGQAAGIAAAIAVDSKKAIYSIDVAQLQNELQKSGVMIHFDDALVPVKEAADIAADDIDHI